MSIKTKTKLFAVTGPAVLLLTSAALADLEVTPYGNAQYRLRENITTITPKEGDGITAMDYSNRLCWRTGLKVKVDDRLSLQFQIGNDWGSAENVNWNANHSPRARVGTHNLYAHLAFARWNPGPLFIEAGIIPVNSNGTLDLLESSISSGWYGEAGFNGWTEMNNSVIGIKLGVPIVRDGVKVSAELMQTVINPRQQATNVADPPANPASALMVLTLPVDAGMFKITPEVTAVINRNFSTRYEAGDHEIIAGAAGSVKVNENISINFNGGYGMISNEASEVGRYNIAANSSANVADSFTLYKSSGLLVGAGATIRNVGPGDIQIALNYNNAKNEEAEDATNYGWFYTDLRYVYKPHKNFSITPRYRTYTTMFPEANANDLRLVNRFELIFEGSF